MFTKGKIVEFFNKPNLKSTIYYQKTQKSIYFIVKLRLRKFRNTNKLHPIHYILNLSFQ